MIYPGYIIDFLQKKYGKELGWQKYLQLCKEQEVSFYLDIKQEPSVVSACDLVTQETAYILLKDFLDTNKTGYELNPDIFCREIAKKNY